MTENEISYIIRGSIYTTYVALGPGLLESAYKSVLRHEIQKAGLEVRSEVGIPLLHDGINMGTGYRLDLLVNNKVIIEAKSVEILSDLHHKQLITYLKLSGIKLGLLVNFNTTDILKTIFRKVNNL